MSRLIHQGWLPITTNSYNNLWPSKNAGAYPTGPGTMYPFLYPSIDAACRYWWRVTSGTVTVNLTATYKTAAPGLNKTNACTWTYSGTGRFVWNADQTKPTPPLPKRVLRTCFGGNTSIATGPLSGFQAQTITVAPDGTSSTVTDSGGGPGIEMFVPYDLSQSVDRTAPAPSGIYYPDGSARVALIIAMDGPIPSTTVIASCIYPNPGSGIVDGHFIFGPTDNSAQSGATFTIDGLSAPLFSLPNIPLLPPPAGIEGYYPEDLFEYRLYGTVAYTTSES